MSDKHQNEGQPPAVRPGLATRLHEGRMFGALLGFTSGFVDTAGFIAFFGLFTAHITGNLILIGAEMAHDQQKMVWTRFAIIPIFILAVVASTVLVAWTRKSGRSAVQWLLWCEAVALAAFALSGLIWGAQLQTGNEALVIFVASSAVIAMGIQITLNKETPHLPAMTNVMTVNLATIVIHLTKGLIRRTGIWADDKDTAAETRNRMWQCAAILAGFAFGVLFAGLSLPRVGYASVFLPMIIIAVLAATHVEE